MQVAGFESLKHILFTKQQNSASTYLVYIEKVELAVPRRKAETCLLKHRRKLQCTMAWKWFSLNPWVQQGHKKKKKISLLRSSNGNAALQNRLIPPEPSSDLGNSFCTSYAPLQQLYGKNETF